MSEYSDELRGALFKNKDKAPGDDKAADYTGTATIEGQDYFMDAWIRTSQKSGAKFMSIRFKAKRGRSDR